MGQWLVVAEDLLLAILLELHFHIAGVAQSSLALLSRLCIHVRDPNLDPRGARLPVSLLYLS